MEAALCTKGVKLEVHPEPDEFFFVPFVRNKMRDLLIAMTCPLTILLAR